MFYIKVFILFSFLSFAEAKRFCGPGFLTFPANPQINECCRQHDLAYNKIPFLTRLLKPWKRRKADKKFCDCLSKVTDSKFHAMFKCSLITAISPFG